MACGEFAQAAQLVARDPDAHRSARRAPGAARSGSTTSLRTTRRRAASSSGQRSCRCQCSVVVERDARCGPAARGDRPAAGCRARRRPAAPSATPRCPRAARPARPRARRSVGLAALAACAPRRSPSACVETRTTRSPRPIRNRSSAPETCRQSSSAQTRSPSSAARPDHQRAEPASADPRPSSRRAAAPVAASIAATVCERLCVSAPSTIIRPSSCSPRPTAGRPADRACWGRCHAPIKSRRASPTGDERHNKRKSGPPADSLKESQLAARPGPSPPRRTSPTTRIRTASLDAIAATCSASRCLDAGFPETCPPE